MTIGAEDFVLSVSLQSSVLELKTRLSQEHPQKPEVTRQRLLFSGKLLQDSQILNQLFNPQIHNLELPQKFHLVVQSLPPNNNNPQQQNPNPNPNMANPPNFNNFQNFNPNGFPQFQQFQGMPFPQGGQGFQGQYYQAYPPQYQPPQYQNFNPNGFPAQGMPGQGMPGQGMPFPQGNFHGQVPPQFQGQFYQGPQFVYPGQFPQQNPNFAAVRGRIINIEISMIIKLAVLVYVLSQGGSVERMFVLAAIAIAYYLYTRGRANPQNNPAGANNNNAQPAGAAAQNQPGAAAPSPRNDSVPDFYYSTTLRGELTRFFVPLVMSLLPSWRLPNLQRPQPQQQNR